MKQHIENCPSTRACRLLKGATQHMPVMLVVAKNRWAGGSCTVQSAVTLKLLSTLVVRGLGRL